MTNARSFYGKLVKVNHHEIFFFSFILAFHFWRTSQFQKERNWAFVEKVSTFAHQSWFFFFYSGVTSIWKPMFSMIWHRRSGSSVGHQHSKLLRPQWLPACCRVQGEGRCFRPMANGHIMDEAGMDIWRSSSPRWTDDREVILFSLLWWWHWLGTAKVIQVKSRWTDDVYTALWTSP